MARLLILSSVATFPHSLSSKTQAELASISKENFDNSQKLEAAHQECNALTTKMQNMDMAFGKERDQFANRIALEQHRCKQETKRCADIETALKTEFAAQLKQRDEAIKDMTGKLNQAAENAKQLQAKTAQLAAATEELNMLRAKSAESASEFQRLMAHKEDMVKEASQRLTAAQEQLRAQQSKADATAAAMADELAGLKSHLTLQEEAGKQSLLKQEQLQSALAASKDDKTILEMELKMLKTTLAEYEGQTKEVRQQHQQWRETEAALQRQVRAKVGIGYKIHL